MSTVNPQAAGLNFNPNLGRDAAIGGGLGLLAGHPILGALGGLAFNLFKTPGMADDMKQAAQNAFSGIRGTGSVGEAVQNLGNGLFGADATRTRPDPEAAAAGAAQAETKSGIPGWAKWLGIGGGALMLANSLFDNFSMNGFGNPLYGGFGMFPFMDPMSSMMGPMGMGGMGMGMGMGGMGMMPTHNLIGGMGLMDLLIAGGVGLGAYHFLKK